MNHLTRFIFILLFCSVASAKNLYVNNSGNPACSNSTTYAANDAAHPWCTIMRAARGSDTYNTAVATQAAQPGDVVLITAGIYWENGQVGEYPRFSVHLNSINNGTASNPITFRGVGNVFLRMNAGFRGGTIGCSFRNYIIWDNFKIEDYYQGSTSDTGPVVFHAANHCQLLNSDIRGHTGSYYHGYQTFIANYRGVSLEPANFIVIRNNRIHDMPGGQNECGIMAYDSNDNLIENNTIYNNGCGVFIKGIHAPNTQARNIVRKNLIYGNRHSNVRVISAQDTLVYQNVVHSAPATGLWAGFFSSERTRFVNNTVYGVHSSIRAQGADLIDVRFLNNIIANSTNSAIFDWTVSSPTLQDVTWNRNLYFGFPLFYYGESSPDYTFAQFQALGEEANGMVADPQFVDAANFNFRLHASSPARTLGVDVLDLNNNGSTIDTIPAGAYITGNEIIGATSTPVVLLRAPSNLRVLP